MSWSDNALMWWQQPNGTYAKISDHSRSPLSESIERIENRSRLADGTLRRYVIAKKRVWSCSWDLLPSTNDNGGLTTADAGWSGEQMEAFHNSTDGAFRMMLRRGSAINKVAPVPATVPYQDDDFYIANVMITEFSKEVAKRSRSDFWNVSITLEEV